MPRSTSDRPASSPVIPLPSTITPDATSRLSARLLARFGVVASFAAGGCADADCWARAAVVRVSRLHKTSVHLHTRPPYHWHHGTRAWLTPSTMSLLPKRYRRHARRHDSRGR